MPLYKQPKTSPVTNDQLCMLTGSYSMRKNKIAENEQAAAIKVFAEVPLHNAWCGSGTSTEVGERKDTSEKHIEHEW